MERRNIIIFTDGSCYWKIRKGGIGVYIQCDGKEYFISKGYSNTTISRCELRAFLSALEAVNKSEPSNVTVWSDSEYVVNGTKKLFTYIQNNWEGCVNVDLWKKVADIIYKSKKMRVRLKWTRGHGTNLSDPIVYGNAVADALADYKNFEYYELDKIEEL
jgi:ribonuclease HI